jgi:hypothetical protein
MMIQSMHHPAHNDINLDITDILLIFNHSIIFIIIHLFVFTEYIKH